MANDWNKLTITEWTSRSIYFDPTTKTYYEIRSVPIQSQPKMCPRPFYYSIINDLHPKPNTNKILSRICARRAAQLKRRQREHRIERQYNRENSMLTDLGK